jgi:hypothetical protein
LLELVCANALTLTASIAVETSIAFDDMIFMIYFSLRRTHITLPTPGGRDTNHASKISRSCNKLSFVEKCMPLTNATNIELYYEDNGPADAPVILLVMGLGAQMIAWPDEFIQGLVGKGFRVIHYDNRDVGMSQRMEGAVAPNLVWTMFKARLGLAG